MRVFEVLFIIAPNVEEGELESLITQISDAATGQGATITKVDRMGRRRLAYPIKKFKDGYYVVLTIEGTGAEIAEIERRMRVLDPIIRYITIRIDEDLKRAEKLRKKRSTRVRPTVRRSSRPGAHAAPPAEEED